MKTPELILIDGSSYLFRAYHALPMLTGPDGHPTGAIYGVLNMLRKLLEEFRPPYFAMIFDPKGKNFRHELYPDYKANRPEMPEELRVQIKPLFEIIRAMGIPLVIVDGVEADDVIGTYCEQATSQGIQTSVSTGDKDLAQLVNDRITLVNTMTGKYLDPKGVQEKFGVKPSQIVDYLSLVGDSVDNIPGIPKVGPKTAAKWLQAHETLQNIVDAADTVKGKVGEYLRDNLEQLPLSRELTTIRTNVPLPLSIQELVLSEPNPDILRTHYEAFGFKTWLKELDGPTSESPTKTFCTHTIIGTQDSLDTLLEQLRKANAFAFDTETTSLVIQDAEWVGMSFAFSEEEGFYLPLAHTTGATQLPIQQVLDALTPIFEDEDKVLIGQNLKYDLQILAKYGVHPRCKLFDTMLASYVLNSTAGAHDLNTLSQKHLQHTPIAYADVVTKDMASFADVPLEQAAGYAAEDAALAWGLYECFSEQLADTPALSLLFETLEVPTLRVLATIESTGVLIDAPLLKQQSEALEERMAILEEQAHAIAGGPFNLNSPKQIREILFEQLEIPVIKKTPTGVPSTSEEVLEQLSTDYELPQLILENRQWSKLKSTYTDKLPEEIHPQTGRVHTSYHQAVTSTGRLSSANPNLQNIPIRTKEGRAVRKAFIAPEGHSIIAADYSQVELRIMAHLSNDPGLIQAFQNHEDVHQRTAADMFGLALDAVTGEERRRAKAINFGLMYGMSAFGLSRQLKCSTKEAQGYMDQYFAQYPSVLNFMESIRKQVEADGFVETLLGRRLYLPEIHSKNPARKKAALRAAVNAPMQGTAADIIKKAMIDIQHWIEKNNAPVSLLMQVHDELVFEVPSEALETVMPTLQEKMENALSLSVPLIVDLGHGKNWHEAH